MVESWSIQKYFLEMEDAFYCINIVLEWSKTQLDAFTEKYLALIKKPC